MGGCGGMQGEVFRASHTPAYAVFMCDAVNLITYSLATYHNIITCKSIPNHFTNDE